MIEAKTRVIEGITSDLIPLEILLGDEPVILKGLVRNWELVQIGIESDKKAIDYLRTFYNGLTVGGYFGDAEINGRYFYNDDVSALNFEKRQIHLDQMLDNIEEHLTDPRPPAFYVGSATIDACLPGLRKNNDLQFENSNINPLASIWLGNPSLVPSHYDLPTNLACCVAGKRRFTLFPPEQIHNLYPGPLELTPGGQVVSMVNLESPDFEKFPRFRKAIGFGQIAELEPGDALFIPSMWWHQVQATSKFNILINYWWSASPNYIGSPISTLYQALLSIRERPESEKRAWKEIFNYYIFGDSELAGEHLPESARGNLGPIDEAKARQLRASVLNRLNR